MKRVLFVDDEPHILQGLQRMLRPMHREWEMAFAGSGADALKLMAAQPFDVIVSDMRMPGMDGAALLSRVMELYPQTVRLVLSGQSDKETIFRSVGPTHQFLAKPCDAETLKATVARAFALRELLGSESLKQLVSRLGTLPVLPEMYTRLMAELQLPDVSLKRIAAIIESDVAMTAKILQYVNSAFFGIRQRVSNPTQAVSLLGLDTIRSLVLMAGAFAQTDARRLPSGFSFDAFSHHSLAVGSCARHFARSMGCDDREVSDAFTAGVLHDVGMLVLAANCPGPFERVLARIQAEPIDPEEAERAEYGASHQEVGAYLLGLWGFSDPIVEAIAYHHHPARCAPRAFSPLAAVHIANALVRRVTPLSLVARPEIDQEYVAACGCADRLDEWAEFCNAFQEKQA